MPRKARRESSTEVYHIIARGNNRNWIFKKKAYKKKMRNLMYNQEDLNLLEVYAWCIMDNHVHMVIKAKKDKMMEAMWNINRLFARHYNYKEKTVGHVFENRYKSEVIESNQYLKGLIRYVHQNPVKAKMVKEAKDYPWSSYKEYIEGSRRTKTMDIMESYFNNDINEYKAYHKANDDIEYMEIKEDLEQIRIDKAQRIISKYCMKYGLTSVYDIYRHKEVCDLLIGEMVLESKLPYRKLAQIAGVSYSRIQEAGARMRYKS